MEPARAGGPAQPTPLPERFLRPRGSASRGPEPARGTSAELEPSFANTTGQRARRARQKRPLPARWTLGSRPPRSRPVGPPAEPAAPAGSAPAARHRPRSLRTGPDRPGRSRPSRWGLPALPLGPTAAGRRPPPSPTCRQPRSSVPALKAALAPRCIALPLTTGSAPSTEIADLEPKSHGNSRSGPRARRRETESAERSGGAGAGRHRASRVLFPKPAATAPGRVAFAHRTKGGGAGSAAAPSQALTPRSTLPKEGCPSAGLRGRPHAPTHTLPLGRETSKHLRARPHLPLGYPLSGLRLARPQIIKGSFQASVAVFRI